MKIQLTEAEIIEAISRFVKEELGSETVMNISVACEYDSSDDTTLIRAVYVDIL